MKKAKNQTKVFLGLSGGVDSAVAAYLLKQEGYQLTCGFMRNWDSYTNGDIEGNPTIKDDVCSQEKDYQDALAVAQCLDLPLVRIDFIKNYWNDVFSDFLLQYQKGNTPNPDILCNKHIKFSAFYDYAKEQGFDYLATGHYARVLHTEKESFLLRAKDDSKDQSYFLAEIPREALRNTLFPLGALEKTEVRKIAEQLQLPVAKKKDSTGICFIGEREFRSFLSNYLPKTEGDIRDIDNYALLGKHAGVMFYTYGQRKGLDISSHMGPWFVAGKDQDKNLLYVAKGEKHPWLLSDACITENHSLLFEKEDLQNFLQTGKFDCTVKLRYRQKDIPATLHLLPPPLLERKEQDVWLTQLENWKKKVLEKWAKEQDISKDPLPFLYVQLHEETVGVSPGQEAVFYKGEQCLGGGRICQALKENRSLQDRLAEHSVQIKALFEAEEKRKQEEKNAKERKKQRARKKHFQNKQGEKK